MAEPALDIRFKILLRDEWLPVEPYLENIGLAVDAYLAEPSLTCCHLQGGFFIQIDGVPWSDDGTVDELWMTTTWLSALAELWRTGGPAQAFPWEESRLTLRREQDELVMEDIHHSGHVAMPRVRVPIVAFTRQLLDAARAFAAYLEGLRAEVRARRRASLPLTAHDQLKELEELLPPPIDHWIAQLEQAGSHPQAGS